MCHNNCTFYNTKKAPAIKLSKKKKKKKVTCVNCAAPHFSVTLTDLHR